MAVPRNRVIRELGHTIRLKRMPLSASSGAAMGERSTPTIRTQDSEIYARHRGLSDRLSGIGVQDGGIRSRRSGIRDQARGKNDQRFGTGDRECARPVQPTPASIRRSARSRT
jgi:hypothetical protein